MKNKKFKQKRKVWFRALKGILKIFIKKPTFVYKGGKPTAGSIILSNHEGASSPLALELYSDFPIRMWGTYEMNSGLKSVYKYLSNVYFHEKQHKNLHLARFISIFACPFVNLFYKGLNLIPTYRDVRLYKTMTESIKTIKDGRDNIVIFPENSDKGYFKHLKSFYAGFVVLAHRLFKAGIDVSIYVAYYKTETREYVFDAPIYFSELNSAFTSKNEMAGYFLEKCNSIGGNGLQEKTPA